MLRQYSTEHNCNMNVPTLFLMRFNRKAINLSASPLLLSSLRKVFSSLQEKKY